MAGLPKLSLFNYQINFPCNESFFPYKIKKKIGQNQETEQCNYFCLCLNSSYNEFLKYKLHFVKKLKIDH